MEALRSTLTVWDHTKKNAKEFQWILNGKYTHELTPLDEIPILLLGWPGSSFWSLRLHLSTLLRGGFCQGL